MKRTVRTNGLTASTVLLAASWSFAQATSAAAAVGQPLQEGAAFLRFLPRDGSGRLREFGSGARLTRRFRNASSDDRLHWNLRALCYVRRTKEQVLPQLPAKRHDTVPILLSNEHEYRLAEQDVIVTVPALIGAWFVVQRLGPAGLVRGIEKLGEILGILRVVAAPPSVDYARSPIAR